MERTVEAGGYATRLIEIGSGPPVLLLHGLGANSAYWSDVSPVLAQSYRLWIPDLLGHGFTARPPLRYRLEDYDRWLSGLVDAMDPGEPLVLVGNSLGGLLCARYALKHPQTVGRLVLVAAAGLTRPAIPWRTRLLYLPELFSRRRSAAVPDAERHIPFLVRGVLAKADVAPHVARLIAAGSPPGARSGAVFTGTSRSLLSPTASLWTRLGELRLPILLVWGDRDPQFPLLLAQKALKRLPQASLAVLPGTGHLPMLEDPAGFLDVLLRWLAA